MIISQGLPLAHKHEDYHTLHKHALFHPSEIYRDETVFL
jgi:hypothetical protein